MSWFKNHSILLVFGLPILGVTLGAIYYMSRKDKEWQEYLAKVNQFEREIVVPSDVVPSLIGRCGANIKQIQSTTDTKINFKEKELNQKDRTCCIRGAKENVMKAEAMILEQVSRWKPASKYEMWIPKAATARVIGRCGENIRLICKSSNASVNVTNNISEDNGQVLVLIRGTQEQIDKAKVLVEDKIAEVRLAPSRTVSSPRRSPKLEVVSETDCETLSLSEVNNGTTFQVYVSSVANPSRFWLQLVSPKAADLDSLTNEMTEYYKEHGESHKLRSRPVIKQIVAFESEEHDSWYRGMIAGIMLKEGEEPDEDTEVDVFNLDFGESNFLRYGNLRELRTNFLSLKFQAIEASLEGIAPLDDEYWPDSTVDYFQDLVSPGRWMSITAQVVSYGKMMNALNETASIPRVRLYLPQSDPGVDVATHLVLKGLAVREKKSEEED